MTTPYTPGGEVAVPIDLTALAIGTRLRTRGGHSARLLANDLRDDEYTCAVAVEVGGAELIETMTPAGLRIGINDEHEHDIVGVEPPKHRVRVRVYRRADGEILAAAFHERSPAFRTTRPDECLADRIIEIEEGWATDISDIHPDMCTECLDEIGEVDAPNGRWTCRACADAMTAAPSPAHPGARHDD